jgi:hypothetical protein
MELCYSWCHTLKKRVFPWRKLVTRDAVGVLHLECDLQGDVGRQLPTLILIKVYTL